MSADPLRRAAALMRERAEAATPGGPRWETSPSSSRPSRAYILPADSDTAIASAPVEDAEHIASWHPAVALAVADWLDAEAESHRADLVGPFPSTCCRMSEALAVARAYLGADA